MKNQEEFLEAEIEGFESPEYQDDFKQLSDARKNDILFKRLLFDYDEDLQESLKKFTKSKGKDPSWEVMTRLFPELKYITDPDPDPLNIAGIVLKETSLQQD